MTGSAVPIHGGRTHTFRPVQPSANVSTRSSPSSSHTMRATICTGLLNLWSGTRAPVVPVSPNLYRGQQQHGDKYRHEDEVGDDAEEESAHDRASDGAECHDGQEPDVVRSTPKLLSRL
jgi:hypothetical protein